MRAVVALVVMTAALAVPVAHAEGCDAAQGQAAFGKCAACHSLEEGKNLVGPSLHGLAGRKAGSLAGFGYSPALKNSGITWDAAGLDRFITDPQAAVPGSRMPFTGIKEPAERAAVVCHVLGGK